MQSNQFLGLVKFFRSEDYLDSLIDGCFHCTPPETYRLDGQEGVSDKFESCAYSYRSERGDSPIVVKLGDIDIADALGLTIHNGQRKDAWLHCWFSLRLPNDEHSLSKLKFDISRMKKEFGEQYAFIPAPNLKPLVERLQELSDKTFSCGEVEYSGDRSQWGNLSKALEYSYQREYRFLFGKCSPSETQPYCFSNPEGFNDLIFKNAEFKLQSQDGEVVWFDLSA